MSKAEFNPKVSSIPPRDGTAPVSGAQGPQKAQLVEKDIYSSSGSDPYKTLLSGQMKAETTPIQEMLGTTGSPIPASKRKKTGMDIFLESFLMGDQCQRASSDDFEDVYVPEIGSLEFRNDVQLAKGIRDRYEGLELMIQRLIAEEEMTLSDPQAGYYMREDEITAMTEHKKELEQQLVFCQRQLEKAKFYYDWAKKSVKEAADKAKAEAEWWNQENT